MVFPLLQFFINAADNDELNWWTAGESKHPVFGQVLGDGMAVVLAICGAEADGDEKPRKPIKVKALAIR